MSVARFSRVFGLTLCIGVSVWGCSEDVVSPTAPPASGSTANPTPPPPRPVPGGSGILWGFVVGASGACIAEATAEIVRGEGTGQSQKQRTPCSAWDYDGGFEFRELTAGAEVTVRASAPGHRTSEATFIVSNRNGYTSVLISLAPLE